MTSEVVRNPTYTYMAAQRLTEMQKKKKTNYRIQWRFGSYENFITVVFTKTLPLGFSRSTSFNDSIFDISATKVTS